MNSGAVSKSILQAAGSTIQTEVTQKCPQGLTQGQIVTSSGGNLACNEIYHATFSNWDAAQGATQTAQQVGTNFNC